MKTIEVALIPKNGRKSFYGKATIVIGGGAAYLKSYNTYVAKVDSAGKFSRLWAGWSATTARHVDAFRELYGLQAINKAAWLNMDVEKGYN